MAYAIDHGQSAHLSIPYLPTINYMVVWAFLSPLFRGANCLLRPHTLPHIDSLFVYNFSPLAATNRKTNSKTQPNGIFSTNLLLIWIFVACWSVFIGMCCCHYWVRCTKPWTIIFFSPQFFRQFNAYVLVIPVKLVTYFLHFINRLDRTGKKICHFRFETLHCATFSTAFHRNGHNENRNSNYSQTFRQHEYFPWRRDMMTCTRFQFASGTFIREALWRRGPITFIVVNENSYKKCR